MRDFGPILYDRFRMSSGYQSVCLDLFVRHIKPEEGGVEILGELASNLSKLL